MARITASASRYSGLAADPIVSRQPAVVRLSSRTIALTRTSAPEAFATASGSAPRPVVSVTKIGDGFLLLSCGEGTHEGTAEGTEAGAADGAETGGRSEVTASVSVACLGAAAASGASVAWKERSSERPA